jgi:DNA-binding response OmpR family regulator
LKILVAEDDAAIAIMLEAELTDAGYQVVGPAATAANALLLAQATGPDLALININLEDGSNGVELARALLENCGAPCLFVSGNMNEARAARDAAIGYIAKPYQPDTLLRAIKVAKAIMNGEKPDTVPRGLELFRDTAPKVSTSAD